MFLVSFVDEFDNPIVCVENFSMPYRGKRVNEEVRFLSFKVLCVKKKLVDRVGEIAALVESVIV